MTHAVIEPFIIYEDMRDENGVTSCTTRSQIYIGGCEGKGKRNDWQFHTAGVHDIVDGLNADREKEDRAPLREFIVVTDRCPTQYLCRQNFLQIAKSGTVIRHCFACKYCFKGRHDSEGGVLKTGNAYNVMRNESGTTPWELYLGGVKNHTLTEKDTEKSPNLVSNINTRGFRFVVYNQEHFDELNQGEHEGKIVLANMNITDDTKTVDGTQQIYMARGFGASPPAGLHRIDEEKLKYATWQLDEISGINQDSEDEDDFCKRITEEGEDDLDLSDQVRLDFIRSKNGTFKNADELNLSKKSLPYLDEFLTRIGEKPLPKTRNTKTKHIQLWFLADKNNKVFIYRSKKDLIKLFNKAMNRSLKEDADQSKKFLIDGILKNSLWDIEDEFDDFEADDDTYNLMVSDIPCACDPCLEGDFDNCMSPFKQWANTRLVTLKEHQNEDGSE